MSVYVTVSNRKIEVYKPASLLSNIAHLLRDCAEFVCNQSHWNFAGEGPGWYVLDQGCKQWVVLHLVGGDTARENGGGVRSPRYYCCVRGDSRNDFFSTRDELE